MTTPHIPTQDKFVQTGGPYAGFLTPYAIKNWPTPQEVPVPPAPVLIKVFGSVVNVIIPGVSTQVFFPDGDMIGYGQIGPWSISAIYGGVIYFVVSGNVVVTLAAPGTAFSAQIELRYGTGTAPSPGDPQTGTNLLEQQFSADNVVPGVSVIPFMLQGLITAFAGDVFWFDLALVPGADNNMLITNASGYAAEYGEVFVGGA